MQDSSDLKEVEATISEFERKLDRLKILYEQYFMGIEKREPTVPLKDVVRVMRKLDDVQIKNTGLRFRFRTLVQRFNTYRTYWNRTLRAIEAGTYHRDIARMRRKRGERVTAPAAGRRPRSAGAIEREMAEAAKRDQASADDPSQIRGAPADQLRERLARQEGGAAPAARSPGAATGRSSLPDPEMQSLYRRLVKAKRMCGEDPSSVDYDSLARSVSRQLPKLREMYGGQDVEFKVVIRSGRPVLKAHPK